MDGNYNFTKIDYDPFAGPEIVLTAPSTLSQQEIWTACMLGGEDASRAYNESVTLALQGEFDQPAFEKALQALVARHESMRMVFSGDGKHLFVHADTKAHLNITDISKFDEAEQQQQVKNYLVSEMHKAFDLVNGPLFRFALFKASAGQHYFVLTAHHIVCDGWSLGILVQGLSKLYNVYHNNTIPLLPEAPRFSDYALQQWELFEGPEYRRVEQFWVKQHRDRKPFEIPTDLQRPQTRTHKSRRDDFDVDPSLVTDLYKLGAKTGCSLVTLMLAAFEVLLNKISGLTEVVVGLPAAGQSATGNYELTGHCVNLLPLRAQIPVDDTFVDYLKTRKSYLLDVFENQMITFGALLNKLNIPRDASRVPLVPVVLNIDIGLDDGVNFEGLNHKLTYNPRAYEAFELFLNISGKDDRLTLECSYNTQLLKPESISYFMDSLRVILKAVAETPDIKIKDIPAGNDERYKSKLKEWNNTTAYYPQVTVHQLFSDVAKCFSQKTAIRFNNTSVSYQDLESNANRLANMLVSSGIKPGSRVGLSVDRSSEMVIALLAILKSGACYIPLDPSFPIERLEYMLVDSGAELLITTQKYQSRINTAVKKLTLESIISSLQAYSDVDPGVSISNTSPAYILYTSGSTGKPKGVEILHYNLVNFLTSMQKSPGITPADKLLAITTISFDIAGLELYLPLLTGAELVIADDETIKDGRLLGKILSGDITMMQATPSTWRMVLDSGWAGNKNLKALCGGEALSRKLADDLLDKCGSLWNMYGPTETTIWSTIKQINKGSEPITIGKPIANTQVFILNEALQPAAIGMEGEICIAGDGVGTGYINREELTAQKFVPAVYADTPGGKMYRTGDLGKFTSNGDILCLGRMDQQVKIRGHRIELDEIQHQLLQLQGIKDAVVTAVPAKSGSYLCAYIIPNTGNDTDENMQTGLWKQALKKSLPDYMIPARIVTLDAFPLTANGKVDRKALPAPQASTDSSDDNDAAATDLENLITGIWKDALGLESIKTTDNFFDIGGQSIIAVQVMSRLEKVTGVQLPLASLFTYPTIKSLADNIESNREAIGNAYNSLVPIKPTGSKNPLYIVHGGGLNVLFFNFIANNMAAEQPVYGLQPKGLNGSEEPLDKIEDIASHYIDAIISQNPKGPYLLAGYSMGGMIAFEMAKQLKAMNKEVKMLAMLDTYAEVSERSEPWLVKTSKKVFRLVPRALFFLMTFIRFPVHTFHYRKELAAGWFKNLFNSDIEPDMNKKVNDAFEEAFHNYKMTPYEGNIHVFKASIPNYYLPDLKYLGWKPYAQNGIKIHEVKGDHRSMMLPPNDKKFADLLQRCLDEVSA